MSYRRRHRWFRRMALGLAFATAIFAGQASVAVAKVHEGTNSSGHVTIDLVQAAAAEKIHDPFPLNGVLGAPDGDTIAFANGIETQQVAVARPDDQANRFAHSYVAAQPTPVDSSSSFDWSDTLTLGLSGLALGLGLVLAIGYLRGPRLAGL
ncbi:MAG: hypothetical protein ACXWZB_05590 [Gaiellaceae bacterium]